LILLVGSFDL